MDCFSRRTTSTVDEMLHSFAFTCCCICHFRWHVLPACHDCIPSYVMLPLVFQVVCVSTRCTNITTEFFSVSCSASCHMIWLVFAWVSGLGFPRLNDVLVPGCLTACRSHSGRRGALPSFCREQGCSTRTTVVSKLVEGGYTMTHANSCHILQVMDYLTSPPFDAGCSPVQAWNHRDDTHQPFAIIPTFLRRAGGTAVDLVE